MTEDEISAFRKLSRVVDHFINHYHLSVIGKILKFVHFLVVVLLIYMLMRPEEGLTTIRKLSNLRISSVLDHHMHFPCSMFASCQQEPLLVFHVRV